jgi:hypothetical protein
MHDIFDASSNLLITPLITLFRSANVNGLASRAKRLLSLAHLSEQIGLNYLI